MLSQTGGGRSAEFTPWIENEAGLEILLPARASVAFGQQEKAKMTQIKSVYDAVIDTLNEMVYASALRRFLLSS